MPVCLVQAWQYSSVVGELNVSFDQYGHAVDNNGDNNADILQVITVNDTIDGRFRLIGSSDLGGSWASPP